MVWYCLADLDIEPYRCIMCDTVFETGWDSNCYCDTVCMYLMTKSATIGEWWSPDKAMGIGETECLCSVIDGSAVAEYCKV